MDVASATTKPRRKVLPNLTAVRIFAAGYVLLYHAFGAGPYDPQPHWYQAWPNSGYQGVSLFFVLSGFILAYNSPDRVDTRKFYILRLARIYPLYLAALLASLPNFFRHGTGHQVSNIFASLLLVQGWIPALFGAINPPAWSLSVEVIFYLLFPFVFAPINRYMHHWKLVLAILAAVAILPPGITHLWLWSHGRPESDLVLNSLSFPLFRMSEFFVGMVFGLRFAQTQAAASGFKTSLAVLLSLAIIGLHGHLPYDVMARGLLALPFGWLLFCLAGYKSKFLSSSPMQLLGEISYGVYLLQFPVMVTLNFLLIHAHVKMSATLLDTFIFVTILPVSYLFYITVEKPGRRLILHLFGVQSHPKPIETPEPSLP